MTAQMVECRKGRVEKFIHVSEVEKMAQVYLSPVQVRRISGIKQSKQFPPSGTLQAELH